jgi:SAM-dependent methyltransferase
MTEVVRDSRGNQFELRPIHCPTCGPGRERVLGKRGGTHQRWGLGVETRIVECESCGLLYPNPFPVPVDGESLYGDPEKYFGDQQDLDRKIEVYRSLAREMRSRRPGAIRLLDIGSGRGDFLHAAKLEGIVDSVGLEFAPAMIEFAKKRFDIDLQKVPAEELVKTQAGSFDVVVLNAVLEHVHDPSALVRSVAALAKPGALLYVDVPREPNLLTMVGNTWNRLLRRQTVLNLQPTWEPFHVFGFNPRAIRTLLERHGFRITELHVHASPEIRAGQGLKDRAKSFVGTQVNRLANVIGYASNMILWAERR